MFIATVWPDDKSNFFFDPSTGFFGLTVRLLDWATFKEREGTCSPHRAVDVALEY